MSGEKIRLDSERIGDGTKKLLTFMKGKVISQNHALEKVAHAFEIFEAGIKTRHKPIMTLFLLGPSGVGKSLISSVLAEFWFKDRFGYTQINCSDYPEANDHAISLLQGAPPGFAGFLDTDAYSEEEIILHRYPILSQWNIDKAHFYALHEDTLKVLIDKISERSKKLAESQITLDLFKRNKKNETEESQIFANAIRELKGEIKGLRNEMPVYKPENQYTSIINFDEIDKGCNELHQIVADIVEEGKLGLKNGNVTNFHNSIITATSNIGSGDMLEALKGEKLGFYTSLSQLSVEDPNLHEKIKLAAMRELERYFHDPAFLGRFDDLIVFNPLSRASIEIIFDLEFSYLKQSLRDAEWAVNVVVTPEVKKFIVDKSVKKVEYGARMVKKKIDHYLRRPLASLRTTSQLVDGETLYVSLENGKLVFDKDTS